MKIKFQADADFNQIIINALLCREPTVDFKTAHAAKLSGLEDEDVLALAAKDSRVLVTHDRKTIPKPSPTLSLIKAAPGS